MENILFYFSICLWQSQLNLGLQSSIISTQDSKNLIIFSEHWHFQEGRTLLSRSWKPQHCFQLKISMSSPCRSALTRPEFAGCLKPKLTLLRIGLYQNPSKSPLINYQLLLGRFWLNTREEFFTISNWNNLLCRNGGLSNIALFYDMTAQVATPSCLDHVFDRKDWSVFQPGILCFYEYIMLHFILLSKFQWHNFRKPVFNVLYFNKYFLINQNLILLKNYLNF